MFSEELERIEKAINTFSDYDKDKRIKRIHNENRLNKNYSIILSSFTDLKVLSVRLGENIENLVTLEKKIRKMPAYIAVESGRYPEEVQIEMRKSGKLQAEIKVDFKALYLFSKILIDQYTMFLHFINPVDGIKGGAVVSFLNSSQNHNINSPFYQSLIKEMGDIPRKISDRFVFYRDKKIVHSQLLNEDVWFTNDMQGNVTISHVDRDGNGQVTSMKPSELLNLVAGFFSVTSKFFFENEQVIK